MLLGDTDNPVTPAYDVFLSYRGLDDRDFNASLFEALQRAGIHAFIADYNLKPGDNAWATMQNALKGARYTVPILSQDYADSRWCLDELVLMMRAPEKVLPVFLDFDLSQDVPTARLARYAAPGHAKTQNFNIMARGHYLDAFTARQYIYSQCMLGIRAACTTAILKRWKYGARR